MKKEPEKMLNIYKKPKEKRLTKEEMKELQEAGKVKDVIVTRYTEVETVNENGEKVIKRKANEINVTKLVNETKKLVKNATAEEKLAELEKIFTK